MIDRLLKSKTAWAAVAGIVTALGAGCTGDLPWPDVLEIVFAGLITIFMRDGIAKEGK